MPELALVALPPAPPRPVPPSVCHCTLQGDKVFLKIRATSTRGLSTIQQLVYHMDPLGSFKVVKGDWYQNGQKIRNFNRTGFPALGYEAPPAPPLGPRGTACSVPFSACDFGAEHNTPSELANIASTLARFDALMAVVGGTGGAY